MRNNYEVAGASGTTLLFSKIKKSSGFDENRNVKIRGTVTKLIPATDKWGNPFLRVFILEEGEKEPVKWNTWKLDKFKRLQVGDKVIAHGVSYSMDKKQLVHVAIIGHKEVI